jgi:hypothetical protein
VDHRLTHEQTGIIDLNMRERLDHRPFVGGIDDAPVMGQAIAGNSIGVDENPLGPGRPVQSCDRSLDLVFGVAEAFQYVARDTVPGNNDATSPHGDPSATEGLLANGFLYRSASTAAAT